MTMLFIFKHFYWSSTSTSQWSFGDFYPVIVSWFIMNFIPPIHNLEDIFDKRYTKIDQNP